MILKSKRPFIVYSGEYAGSNLLFYLRPRKSTWIYIRKLPSQLVFHSVSKYVDTTLNIIFSYYEILYSIKSLSNYALSLIMQTSLAPPVLPRLLAQVLVGTQNLIISLLIFKFSIGQILFNSFTLSSIDKYSRLLVKTTRDISFPLWSTIFSNVTTDCRLGGPLPLFLFYNQLPNRFSKDLKAENFLLNSKNKINI